MDDITPSTHSPSPKRRRDLPDDEDDDTLPRKRSASRSPSARRYHRTDSDDDDDDDEHGRHDTHHHRHRHHHHHYRSHSRSSSPRSSSSPPPKPTCLHYAPALVLHGHKKAISCVKFSPDGRSIASASADCTIKIWSFPTGALEHTLEGHLAGISTLSWAPDSKILASGSDDKSIRLWDTATGLAYPTPLTGHHSYVYSIAFSPKGNMLVSGSYDEAVYLWDVRAARVMRSLPAHSDPVGGVDFVRDGTLVVSCSHDGLIRIWDTATGQCLRTLVHEDNASVSAVLFSPNGRYVLAWTLDNCIRLWNYIEGKGKCVKTYQGHVNTSYSLSGAFGTYGAPGRHVEHAFVASGSEDGEVVIWDVCSKHVLQRLDGHDGAVLSLDCHPTEKVIVSAGLDGVVRLWTDNGKPHRRATVTSDTEHAMHGTSHDNGQAHEEVTHPKPDETIRYDPNILPPNPFA